MSCVRVARVARGCGVPGVRALVVIPVTKLVCMALGRVDVFGAWLIEVGSVCVWCLSVGHTALEKMVEARCQCWDAQVFGEKASIARV